jgi:hypothetical protein
MLRVVIALWSSPAWRAQAVAWLDAQLAPGGIERTGEVEQPHLHWVAATRETLASVLDD